MVTGRSLHAAAAAIAAVLLAACGRPPARCAGSAEDCAACNPETCAGCCDGKICRAGTAAAACGEGGGLCQSCDPISPVCSGGKCNAAGAAVSGGCTAQSCSGCCQGGQCYAGDSVTYCGPAGAACRSCGGDQFCTDFACVQPEPKYRSTLLATGQAHPFAIVVDDGFVYWTNVGFRVSDGSVMKVPKTGGAAVALATAQGAPFDLALFEGALYWNNAARAAPDANGNVPGAGILKIPVTGGPPAVLVQGRSPLRLAVTSDGIFWTNQDGTVMRAGLDGSNPRVLASGQRPLDLAVDSASVYWTNGYQAHDPAEPRAIQKVPIAGGPITTIAARESQPTAIAVDSAFVYWSTQGGSIRKAPLNGGPAVTLATGQDQPSDLLVDAGSVYWVNSLGGEVMVLPRGASAAVELTSGAQDLVGLALDADSLYWTDVQDSSIGTSPRR